MKNLSFEIWVAVTVICCLYAGFAMTGFSMKARSQKKIEANSLRRAILRALPGSLLGGLSMGMGFADLLKLWEIDQRFDMLFAGAIVLGIGIIFNIVFWIMLLLNISLATTLYGKDAPKIVKGVVKSLLRLK